MIKYGNLECGGDGKRDFLEKGFMQLWAVYLPEFWSQLQTVHRCIVKMYMADWSQPSHEDVYISLHLL